MDLKHMKRACSVILSLILIVTLFPSAVYAEGDAVRYIKRVWNESAGNVVESEETVTQPLRSFPGECEGGGWYYISSDKTCNDRVTIPANASVNLILADGVTLDCRNGIYVSSSAELNVYGQKEGTGTLKATAPDGSAGIGGDEGGACGRINIYGGTINSTGGSHGAGIGTGEDAEGAHGDLCIYGGDVTARGGKYGAGIGGGDESTGAKINIYGGTVTAYGGDEGAGIGGGCNAGPDIVTIFGGTVSGVGGKYGAGIGEGYDATTATSSGKIVIKNAENVTGSGGYLAAGIGGGFYNNTKINVSISGGKVEAYGSSGNDCGAAGIGAGSYTSISGVLSGGGDFGGTITISGGEVHAAGSGTYASFLGVNSGAAGLGAGFAGNMTGTITVSGGKVHASGNFGGAAIGAGGEDKFGTGGECEGRVNITGGTLELVMYNNTVDDKAAIIGHGCDGDENGTLTLGGTIRVGRSVSAPVASGDRDSTCHSVTGYLYITECKHENALYPNYNEITHLRKCKNCLYSEDEEHFFFEGQCACGAEGFGVFFFDDGELYDSRMSFGHGGTVTPPADPSAEGYIFSGWVDPESDSPKEPFDFSAPVNRDIFLQAHWKVFAGVMGYNRTTQTPLSGGKVRFGPDGDFYYTSNRTVEIGEFVQLEALANEGYDFVGWAYADDPDTIISNAGTLAFTTRTEAIFYAVFEKHTHSLRFVPGYPAKCEDDGEIDHYKCVKCGKLFLDPEDLTEISEDDTVIPALDHAWGEPEYEWSSDHSLLTARRVCANDPAHVEEETVETTPEITRPATCTEMGETTYTSAAFENPAFTKQSLTVDDIAPEGHAYGIRITPPTCEEGGITTCKCVHCGDTFTKNPTDPLGHTDENRDGVCDRCNKPLPGDADGGCKWCGKTHTGFFGGIVGFIHSILYFFSRIFRF